MSNRTSTNGITRHAGRGGNVARLNATSCAFASWQRGMVRCYDGSTGKTASVSNDWLTAEAPMLTPDREHVLSTKKLLSTTELPSIGE